VIVCSLLTTLIAIIGLLNGVGPFSAMSNHYFSLIFLEGYIVTGTVTGFVVAAFLSERRKTTRTLDRLASVVEASNNYIILADRDGHVEYCNMAAKNRICGAMRLQMVGEYFSADMRKDSFQKCWSTALAEGRWVGETVLTDKEGIDIFVDLVLIAHYDKYGDPVRVSMVAHDITAIKNNEKNLQHANDALQVVINQRAEFVSLVSHELRTPLSSMKSSVEVLLEGEEGELNDEQKEMMQILERGLDRMLRLVQNILDYSKIEAGRKISLNIQKVDLIALVHEVFKFMRPLAERKGIQFHFVESLQKLDFYGDTDRMQQLFINLFDNALKYTPEGGCVSAYIGRRDGSAYFTVSDTGKGIPHDDLPYIFDLYRQSGNQDHRVSMGSGIGLSVCKQIVELHGGHIDVSSEPKKGSTFTIRLPLQSKEIYNEDESGFCMLPHLLHQRPDSGFPATHFTNTSRPLIDNH
jgi:PAS domain S-box-containing protein